MNLNFSGIFTPQYLIIFAIAILGFGTCYFFYRRRAKSQKVEDKTKDGEIHFKAIDALIYDRTTQPFTWYEKTLEPLIVKAIVESHNLSRQVNYMGKKVFRFYKLLGNEGIAFYESVIEPDDVKNSPRSLYIDMQHPYTPIIDDMTVEKNFMQKYGHLLIWLGVIAFLIVLVITNKK